MGLFQKQPITNTQPLYNLGLDTVVLIMGLGNVGKEFVGTRHNIGFAAVDYFAKKQTFPEWIEKKDLKCTLTTHSLGKCRVILAKPTTLMNNSGQTLQAVQHFYRIDNSKTLVIHDELDIDFGQIRTRQGGGPAGHNGIKSIIENGGEETQRLRIGIGPKKPPQIDSTNFVLAKFDKVQQEQLDNLYRETSSLLTEYIYSNGQLAADTRSFII